MGVRRDTCDKCGKLKPRAEGHWPTVNGVRVFICGDCTAAPLTAAQLIAKLVPLVPEGTEERKLAEEFLNPLQAAS